MPNATQTDTQTYVVRIDLDGKPYMRSFAEATSPEEAVAQTQERLDRDREGEVAAEAVPFQPILDAIIERREQGTKFALSFKHEYEDDDTFVPLGPVWITDMDAMRAEAEAQGAVRDDGAIVISRPFGVVPDYETPLPWMEKGEAARLAKYLGVPFGEA